MRTPATRGRAREGSSKIARNGKAADMGCNVSKDVKVEDQGNAENKDDGRLSLKISCYEIRSKLLSSSVVRFDCALPQAHRYLS
ncbi:hypothetical protein TNCT_19661 [Trichonephila clavata]|uniref:Uncharacterized protein n=1 Tax=Trichonephila clavata TaxID=2740835 RepID=A0A8X6GSE7_TRICU|nr:hypothetical protein TNCT_19661 [Trichonephila clavata]